MTLEQPFGLLQPLDCERLHLLAQRELHAPGTREARHTNTRPGRVRSAKDGSRLPVFQWRKASETLANGADSASGLFDGLKELVEGFCDEEHILEVVDLERLIEDGVERERPAVAFRAKSVRGIAL